MSEAPRVEEDVFAEDALEDPYPLYDRLRAGGPVHWLPEQDLYLVVRHAEILEALDDPDTFSSHLVAVLQVGHDDVGVLDVTGAGAADVLATADPPAHTAQRRTVQPHVSRPAVGRMADRIGELVDPRVARLVDAGGGDWMAAVAAPLPVLVIVELIGLVEDDVDQLTAWSDAAVELLSGTATPARLLELVEELGDFLGHLRRHLDRARRDGADGLLGVVAAEAESGALTGDEAVAMLLQLVTAGTESTTSLLGSAVRVLADDPATQARLRGAPGDVDAFVEEVLRLESPFRGHFRVTTRPTELGGVHLPAGARLLLLWGSANRDPEVFDDPTRLDVDRAAVRSHVGFGRGVHFCLGAHLARLEATIAVRALLDATSEFQLADDADARHVPSLFVRRLQELSLRTRPA